MNLNRFYWWIARKLPIWNDKDKVSSFVKELPILPTTKYPSIWKCEINVKEPTSYKIEVTVIADEAESVTKEYTLNIEKLFEE